MSLLENVRAFICGCPCLKDGKFNVDYLGDRQREYTIDVVPTNPVVKRYVNGDSLRQFVFMFASREPYGADVLQNLENNGFYEQFAGWLEEQVRNNHFPKLDGGRQVQNMEALTYGYLFDGRDKNARYQIQCRLLYLQRGI